MESSGTIEVTSTGGTAKGETSSAYAWATAIGIETWGSTNLKNRGDIIVHAKGGTAKNELDGTGTSWFHAVNGYASAFGISINNSASITNFGDITATAVNGTVIGGSTSNDNSAWAEGISGSSSDELNNRGDIYVSAASETDSATAIGISLGRISKDNPRVIINSGNIRAYAEGTEAEAYGIYIDSGWYSFQGQEGVVNLTNTGMIRASAASSAYEVYINSGSVSLSNTYTLVLDGSPEVGSIYIAVDADLDLNGASLTVSSVVDELQWNTPYKIFDNDGTISNGFGTVSAANPNVTATYYDQGTTDASDDTVSLIYGRENSPSPFTLGAGLLTKSMAFNGESLDHYSVSSFLTRSIGGHSVRIADSGQMASDAGSGYFESAKKWEFFAIPYYSRLDHNDAFAGYRADSIGTSFGVERKTRTADDGFHLGYGNSDVDYTLSGHEGSEEDLDMFSAGIHALGRIDQWLWRLRMTGFKGQSDYSGVTGINLTMKETAEYDTYGISSRLTGGYLYKFGRHAILPEIGFEHIWIYRDGFTTQAESPAWNLTVDSLDEHQVTALADVTWLGRFEKKRLAFIPSVSAGIRQLFSDNEISVLQSIYGMNPYTATTVQDDLSFALAASLLIETDLNLTMEITYDGAYGDNTDRHSLWGKISYYF